MRVLIELYDLQKPLHNVVSGLVLKPDIVVFMAGVDLNVPLHRRRVGNVFRLAGLGCRVLWQTAADSSYEAVKDALTQVLADYEGNELIADVTGGSEYMLTALAVVRELCPTLSIIAFRPNSDTFVQLEGRPFDVLGLRAPCFTVPQAVALCGGELVSNQRGSGILSSPAAAALIGPFMEVYLLNHREWVSLTRYFQQLPQPEEATDGSCTVPDRIVARGRNNAPCECRFPAVLMRRLLENGIVRSMSQVGADWVFTLAERELYDCLRDVGMVLELYVYRALGECGAFDSVEMSCQLSWDDDADDDDVLNEVDVIATSGVRELFVSCKSGKVDNSTLNEISALTARFGNGYATPVVVSMKNLSEEAPELLQRAGEMGVEVIELDELAPDVLTYRLSCLAR